MYLFRLNDTYKKIISEKLESEHVESAASCKHRGNVFVFPLKGGPYTQTQGHDFTPGMLWHELMWDRPCHKICIYYSQQWERKETHAS